MNNALKTALSSIILVTTFGNVACNPDTKNSRVGDVALASESVTGIPMGYAQYTQTAQGTNASYTFPINVNGKRACANFYGGYSADREYDRMVIALAHDEKQSVTFQANGRTSNGCYSMTSRPSFFNEPVDFR